MASFKIRKFTPKDIPQVMALQGEYQEAYPFAGTIPGETYLSAGFENGKNIFCAFDEGGRFKVMPRSFLIWWQNPISRILSGQKSKSHPGLASPWELKDALFARVMSRAKQITQPFPDNRTNLTFQYHPSEIFSIGYLRRTRRLLHRKRLPHAARPGSADPVPAASRKHDRAPVAHGEQDGVAGVRPGAQRGVPEAPVTLADWQYFLKLARLAGGDRHRCLRRRGSCRQHAGL